MSYLVVWVEAGAPAPSVGFMTQCPDRAFYLLNLLQCADSDASGSWQIWVR